jgi:hypothetical protein
VDVGSGRTACRTLTWIGLGRGGKDGVDQDWDRDGRRRHEGGCAVGARSSVVERRGGDERHEGGSVGRGGEATHMKEAAWLARDTGRANEKKGVSARREGMNGLD